MTSTMNSDAADAASKSDPLDDLYVPCESCQFVKEALRQLGVHSTEEVIKRVKSEEEKEQLRDELETIKSDLTVTRNALQEARSTLHQNAAASKSDIDEAKNETKEAEKKFESSYKEKMSLQQQLLTSSQRIKALENHKEASTKKITELKATAAIDKTKIQELSAQLEAQKQYLDSLKSTLAEKDRELISEKTSREVQFKDLVLMEQAKQVCDGELRQWTQVLGQIVGIRPGQHKLHPDQVLNTIESCRNELRLYKIRQNASGSSVSNNEAALKQRIDQLNEANNKYKASLEVFDRGLINELCAELQMPPITQAQHWHNLIHKVNSLRQSECERKKRESHSKHLVRVAKAVESYRKVAEANAQLQTQLATPPPRPINEKVGACAKAGSTNRQSQAHT